ncbi:MAG: V-type ATPase 116kDa subunit family protein [Chitinispirillia bacterium]|jgi:V/A-type H+-transporting ATPase subunit I
MIVPMKKLSLLLYHKDRELFLSSLQDLGAVHIVENSEIISENLTLLQNRLKRSEEVLKGLSRRKRNFSAAVLSSGDRKAQEIIQEYDNNNRIIEQIDQKITSLKKECKTLQPWGNFKPSSIKRLKNANINIRFFELSEKKYELLPKNDLIIEEINRQSGIVYFIVIQRDNPVSIDADEVLLPQISLQDARNEITALENDRQKADKLLNGLVKYENVIEEYVKKNTDKKNFESALINLGEAAGGKILSLTGWIPQKNEKNITAFLNKFTVWYQFSEPAKNDTIPVQLNNRKTIKLFEPVLKIYSLPDYYELDPTPYFAPFFAFFFGLCLADLGYGLILLIVSSIGLAKAPKKMHPHMFLGFILGLFTLVGGFLLNTFFGHPIFASVGAENGYFKSGAVWALLNPVVTESGTYFPAMPFALYIGILQILTGVFIKLVNEYKNRGAIYTLQPISSVLMILGITIIMSKIDFIDMGKFTFGIFKLGPVLNAVSFQTAYFLTFSGLAILFLFNNPNKNILVRLGMGFWELYQFGSGLMGDALSYLRLFALGLAGGLLGAAFNQIAFMFILTADGSINYATPMVIFTILVLIVGHVLNFILAALGSFVHPLRLTFVEFYNNITFKGGGKPFHPFSKAVK